MALAGITLPELRTAGASSTHDKVEEAMTPPRLHLYHLRVVELARAVLGSLIPAVSYCLSLDIGATGSGCWVGQMYIWEACPRCHSRLHLSYCHCHSCHTCASSVLVTIGGVSLLAWPRNTRVDCSSCLVTGVCAMAIGQ